MAVVFDTYAWVKCLKEAGFTEAQVEVEVNLVAEALMCFAVALMTEAGHLGDPRREHLH